ncbi:hypothetical protein [Paraflavitalea sp. CAU 1676]|uniref:hypothetical protein n=1 Tax=Paraflavitalea sp. CAU 1676 TaxID=3032598 RepID=UPI0023D9D936|nr:hypothetical protein [Paraflavitalea sp. CAU 1676]MDF2188252.1 hypothetical protein [Paraflavitalea sp. CAU 1676]
MNKLLRYYYPGMVSLLGFPLLVFWLISDAPSVSPPKMIRLFMPMDDCIVRPHVRYFDKCAIKDDFKGKLITTVSFHEFLPGHHHQMIKQGKLNLIRREVERVTFTNNSRSVIKVEFGEEITFGDVYYLLNTIQELGVKRYAWFSNELYIFGNEPPTYEQ